MGFSCRDAAGGGRGSKTSGARSWLRAVARTGTTAVAEPRAAEQEQAGGYKRGDGRAVLCKLQSTGPFLAYMETASHKS